MEAHAIMRDDAGGLLAAMLQRVQAQGRDRRRIRDIPSAEDAAFLMRLVIIDQN